MGKRRPALTADQMAFTFVPPQPATAPASLAGLGRRCSAAVAAMLNGDPRSREEIAGAVAALTGENCTRWMLDSYASEAREDHAVPAHRLFALAAVTGRYDCLDALMREIGASLLVGEELLNARIGHLRARRREISSELAKLEAAARPISRGGRS